MASKKNTPKSPVWFQWLMLAFIGFVILNQLIKGKEDPAKILDLPSESTVATKRDLKDPVHPDQKVSGSGNYAELLFPDVPRRVEVADKKQGEGAMAACGSTVSVRYDAKFQNGELAESNRKDPEPLTFIVGSGETLPALEQAVESMQKGGVREIVAVSGLAYGHPKHKKENIPEFAPIFFEMELVDVKNPVPATPAGMLGFRRFDHAFLTGWFASCGDKLAVNLRIFDKNGSKRFDNRENGDKKPLEITLGASQVPFGIEQGLIGIRRGGVRTLFVPVEYASPLDSGSASDLLKQLNLPENEPFIADVELAR